MANSRICAWIEASRPKTLAAAIVPIAVGTAMSYREGFFDWYPVSICLAFALLVQIATNMANDYFDYIKGADTEDRLGPERMVASGRVNPKAMFVVAVGLFVLAFFIGLNLVYYRGWEMLIVGIVSIIFGYAYTGGPFPLAYNGLGDVFVVFFFGLVATVGTFYVIVGSIGWPVAFLGLALGLLANNILVVNNYRDRETDSMAGKRTLVVRHGRAFARKQYWLQIGGAYGLLVAYSLFSGEYWLLLPLGVLPLGVGIARKLESTSGAALNHLLADSAKHLLFFGALLSVGLCL